MAIEIQDLAALDSTRVDQMRAYIAGLVQEENPTLDLRRGVLHDLLFHYSAILAAANQTNIDRVRQANSLLAISREPELADDDTVDRVLSNFKLERRLGVAADGTVTIVVNKLAPVTVPASGLFIGDGKEFQTSVTYSAVTSSAHVSSDTDRVLTPRGDGTYSFTVEVNAVQEGVASMLRKNALLIPQFTLQNYVTSYAASDFINGRDTETNAALMLRMQEGIAAKALSNRVNMYALLRDRLEDYIASSVIGYGDAEMLRDRHSVFPISHGGRADWYVRTQELPQLIGFTKTATLVSKTLDGYGIWQFGIGREEAPGFYDVPQIKRPADTSVDGSFEIVADIRANDLTNISGELTPDIETVAEGAYSRYQSAVIQFKDDVTTTAALTVGESTATYDITIRAMKDVAVVQTLAANRNNRNYAGDVLAKAAVPCFVSLAVTLEGRPGAVLPEAAPIRDALASHVNRLGFVGRLSASELSDIINAYLPTGVTHSAIDMFAQIRRPDGSVKPLRSSEVIVVPYEPSRMVTARTTLFILDPDSIQISAETLNIPEV